MAAKTAVPVPTEESVPLPEVASRLRLAVLRLSRRLRRHAPVGHHAVAAVRARHDRRRRAASRFRSLAEAERVQPPSITRVVDCLVTLGFVTRTQSDEDRRVAWVAPTDEGRALVDSVRRQRDLYLAQRLRTFTRRGPRRARPRRGAPRTAHGGPAMTRVRRLGRDTFASLHNRNYRLYFVGQTISVSGTWMQQLAQAVLILQLTNKSGTALGILTALQFVPMLVFGVWGGVIADRFDKRRILFGTQIAAGVLALAMGLIVSTGNAAVWNVYLLSFLLGFVNVVDNPARQTFVLEMVGRDDLPNAVSLNSVVMNSSRVVGPAIGGRAHRRVRHRAVLLHQRHVVRRGARRPLDDGHVAAAPESRRSTARRGSFARASATRGRSRSCASRC